MVVAFTETRFFYTKLDLYFVLVCIDQTRFIPAIYTLPSLYEPSSIESRTLFIVDLSFLAVRLVLLVFLDARTLRLTVHLFFYQLSTKPVLIHLHLWSTFLYGIKFTCAIYIFYSLILLRSIYVYNQVIAL